MGACALCLVLAAASYVAIPIASAISSATYFWAHRAEADRIAKEVQHLLQAAGSSLSIGVITFYAAQRDLIMEKLAKTEVNGISLMVRRDGELVPTEEFATTIDGEEGLRVGSVDAFQGKEFDVVLLSCVRTFYQPKDKKG